MKITIEITGSPKRGPSALTSMASGVLAGAATSLFTSFLTRDRGHDEAFDDCDGKGGKVPFGISFDVPKDAPVAPASGRDGLMSTLASVLSSLGPILSASMAKHAAPQPTSGETTPQIGKCPWCGGDCCPQWASDPDKFVDVLADGGFDLGTSFECGTCKKRVRLIWDGKDETATFAKVETTSSPAAATGDTATR